MMEYLEEYVGDMSIVFCENFPNPEELITVEKALDWFVRYLLDASTHVQRNLRIN